MIACRRRMCTGCRLRRQLVPNAGGKAWPRIRPRMQRCEPIVERRPLCEDDIDAIDKNRVGIVVVLRQRHRLHVRLEKLEAVAAARFAGFVVLRNVTTKKKCPVKMRPGVMFTGRRDAVRMREYRR